MELKNQTAVVTGGSRGLGLGIVEALVDQGANVTVVARTKRDLEKVAERLGVATVAADVTDRAAARRILAETRPAILVLNAGAPPSMATLDAHDWESFSHSWETDVKAGLHWVQAALETPLAPGSRVLMGSSGAAVGGSPMSGGYGGAKRMLWMMANYADKLAAERGLGIRFQTVVPRQMIPGTGTGDAASSAYSAKFGIPVAEYLERFGAPMPPRRYGEHLVALLSDPRYAEQRAFGLSGSEGIAVLEEAAA
ncbi:SDR family NAD(P)-dependent oxidoreductase [Sphingomonas sp.]|uniref:SDR family NAD(P)-dependent oxidoreductase n=1 Tax=Sphingomonas sp. TaxID=28214 RepID=UPI0031DE19F2